MHKSPPAYLPLSAVAERAGVDPSTVTRWTDSGVLKCERFGHVKIVKETVLDRFLAARAARAAGLGEASPIVDRMQEAILGAAVGHPSFDPSRVVTRRTKEDGSLETQSAGRLRIREADDGGDPVHTILKARAMASEGDETAQAQASGLRDTLEDECVRFVADGFGPLASEDEILACARDVAKLIQKQLGKYLR